jgi:signal transduction histidine kinase
VNMNMKATSADRRGRPLGLVRLQQGAKMHKLYVAEMPRWRHPLIGCATSIPLVALGLVAFVLGKQVFSSFYFAGSFIFLSILAVALFWGVGPALFSVLLSTLGLDYFYVSQVTQITIGNGYGFLQLAPFIVAGIIIALITGQRESARRQALFAERMANERAEQLEQLNKQLEEANQLKDQFISMSSHELKTPITTIRGLAQVMLRRLSKQQESPKDFEEVRTALEKIDGQTYRLTALVDDLLVLSSIRAGRIELRLQFCDIRNVCNNAVEEQRQLTGRAIELEMPDMSVTVKLDRERLGQVVTNLVSNAVKYSPDESVVQVRVGMSMEQEQKMARIEVRDRGQGISAEEQKRIFETFYRAPNAQVSKKNGWGLGLAICKDIVERHNGRIWCESELGKGSMFVVELPM